MFTRSIPSITLASILALCVLTFASAASALTVSCSGVPGTASIVWSASASGGVQPYSFVWGNGSTSTTQTVAGVPGVYSMNLQATDASSTIATTTCSATIAHPAPTISSFTATPSSITAGQSSILAWSVSNASSTSINNGVGVVSSTSLTISPLVTTTYQLSATNPSGTVTSQVTVTVNATTTGSGVSAQIQALLNQINALKAQILLLIQQNTGGTGGNATSTPPGFCFDFKRDLRHGDKGDDVKELQRQLSMDASIFPPGSITGFFGPKTEEALKKFQRKFGIFSTGSTTTGYFGPKSRSHFMSVCSSGDPDHDGLRNFEDSDDDNDGIPDASDPKPHSKNKSSDDDDDRTKRDNDNRGKGNGKGNDRDDD